MRVVIAGGTGFLGQPLAEHLAALGHDVVILTRGEARRASTSRIRQARWSPDGEIGGWGAGIGGAAARSLAGAIERASAPPSVFISGSAVGYYGPRADEVVGEDTPAGSDFLAQVCVRWEAEASGPAHPPTRLV